MTEHAEPLWKLPVRASAVVGGRALGAGTALLSRLRPTTKPFHPRGSVWTARIERSGSADLDTGVPWLDTAGVDEALVRLSAGIGLPAGWPDIRGLAIHLPDQDEADLLLASAGLGQWSRFVLRLERGSEPASATTLVPLRTSRGPIMLAAGRIGWRHFALWCAAPQGDWSRFAELGLHERIAGTIDFDPVLRPLPGTTNYAWVRRLREPAYRTARRDRGAEVSTSQQ